MTIRLGTIDISTGWGSYGVYLWTKALAAIVNLIKSTFFPSGKFLPFGNVLSSLIVFENSCVPTTQNGTWTLRTLRLGHWVGGGDVYRTDIGRISSCFTLFIVPTREQQHTLHFGVPEIDKVLQFQKKKPQTKTLHQILIRHKS